MPPFVSRKRRDSTPPAKAPTPKKKKPSLFDAADELTSARTLGDTTKFVDSLNASQDDSSSLSEADSSDFEDGLPAKKRKTEHEDSDEEDIEWEDALQPDPSGLTPAASGDLELTLTKGMSMGTLTDPHGSKKGPSKIERQIRVATHCMHVQFLMFHNWSRSAWASDRELQKILFNRLDAGCKKAVEDWRRMSGMNVAKEDDAANAKPKGRGRPKKVLKVADVRSQRDWGSPAVRLEAGSADLSHGDPVLKLLSVLITYWRKNFTVVAPALRKVGYLPLVDLEKDLTSFHNDKHNQVQHGEKIDGIEQFRRCAKKLEGSRDVGAQLFTALLRGLGIEARLVASLQPVGFGWNKSEEASQKKRSQRDRKSQDVSSSEEEEVAFATTKSTTTKSTPDKKTPKKIPKKQTSKGKANPSSSSRKQTSRGAKDAPIDLSDDSSVLSSLHSSDDDDDDDSVIDITPPTPSQKSRIRYDRDLLVPNYWTEVVAPLTQRVFSVEAVVTGIIATNDEKLLAFEPRGKKAENAKQVRAYTIAFSPDGTAKDVTTRYLKRHTWPGKTKGVRLPAEKVPVYNRRGKVKRYEQYDWFKTVMSGYNRPDHLRLPNDDIEDATDLKIVKPEKREAKEGVETLQGYKQSADFVLERHLRREEALLPDAKPVKTFVHGKGDKAAEEPVYRRKDVAVCRTAESWHKEGRQIKVGMHPMKMVPVRAVTLTRKREVEEAERDTGEKLKQGMYSKDQTEWIIPPPIENGVIPKNAYGNIDCFVDSMVPEGAVHVPYRGTMRVCKKLGIDFAEAVVGFEFGNKRAVPVCQGVVIAEENEEMLLEAWKKDEEEKRIKEEGKREKLVLGTWRKFLMGLRIVERVREEYGDEGHERDDMNPFTNKRITAQGGAAGSANGASASGAGDGNKEETGLNEDEDMGGGFIVDDEDE